MSSHPADTPLAKATTEVEDFLAQVAADLGVRSSGGLQYALARSAGMALWSALALQAGDLEYVKELAAKR